MKKTKLEKITLKLQQELIDEITKLEDMYFINIEGKNIIILPNVFPPATDSILLAKNMKIEKNAVVLDAFSGSGIITVFAGNKAKKNYCNRY